MTDLTSGRSTQNEIGDRVELLAQLAFPPHWVIRDLPKDYGLDLNIEIFRRLNDKNSQTTGQHLYAQVKSSGGNIKKVNISGKTLLAPNIPVKTLATVAAMGPSVPVLLLYVDIVERIVYWVCLNDYIDNVLRVDNPNFKNNDETTIHIDPNNVLDDKNENFWMIEALSQRAKLYATFNLFTSMGDFASAAVGEIDRIDTTMNLGGGNFLRDLGTRESIVYLEKKLRQALAMDIWDRTGYGSMQWDQLDGLNLIIETLLHAISGLRSENSNFRGGPLSINDAFTSATGQYQGRELCEIFSHREGLTPLTPFLNNFKLGFEILQRSSRGFEEKVRWYGLHKSFPFANDNFASRIQ